MSRCGDTNAATHRDRSTIFYDGKEGLFEVVVETLMQEMHAGLARESQAQVDPLAALQQGVGAFLSVCAEPSIRQILLIDAPAVLGWQRWRELDTKYGFGLLKRAFSAAMATGLMRPGDVDVFAHLLLGAIIEAAMLIARSPHPAEARKAAERTLVGLIEGCRIRQGGTSESPPQA